MAEEDQPLKVTVKPTPPLESGGLGAGGWDVISHEPALPGPGPELPAVDDWSVQSVQPMQGAAPSETMGDASYIARKPNPWQVVSQVQQAPPVDNFQPGGGSFRGDVPQAAPADPWKPVSHESYGDFRDYPADYSAAINEGAGTMAKGVGQLKSGEKLYGAGNVALGAMKYGTAPIEAGLRSVVGRPLERRTGIPKEYSELVAGLALPGIGFTRMPQYLTPGMVEVGGKVLSGSKLLQQILSPESSLLGGKAAGLIRQEGGLAARDTAKAEYMADRYQKPFTQRVVGAAKAIGQGDFAGAANQFFDNFARQINQLPEADRLNMLHYMETRTGAAQPRGTGGKFGQSFDPKLKPIADQIRKQFNWRKQKILNSEWGKDADMVQDYVTHYWQDPAAAQRFVEMWRGGKQGTGRNLKKRELPTIAEGIAAGLKPVTTDPLEIMMRYVMNMDRYIAANNVLSTGRKLGDVVYYKQGARNVPFGWSQLKGMGSTKQTPAGVMQAYAPDDWANVYNNFISRGVHANAQAGRVYDAWMRASNATTAMLLGMSGYHTFTMAEESFISGVARGMGQMFTGIRHLQPKMLLQGAKSIASAPGRPVAALWQSKKVEQTYLGHGNADPFVREVTKLLAEAGGRAVGSKHAQDYQFSQMGSFWDSWRRGSLLMEAKAGYTNWQGKKVIGAFPTAANLVGRSLSTIAAPIFNHYIPMIKRAAFYDDMSAWLKANLGATKEEKLVAARKIWDSVDNRLGETVHANIFWNQMLKQAAVFGLLSYSWNLGTIREIGGGIKDLAANPDALDMTSKDFSPRAAYVIAFPIAVATVNSVYQFLKTGKLPFQTETPLQDLAAPRTGGMVPPIGGEFEPRTKKDTPANRRAGTVGEVYKNDAGRRPTGKIPERAILPGYQKDVFGWFAHPGQEAWNKLAPFLKMTYETIANKDWKNDPIMDRLATPPEQLKQYMEYVIRSRQPITMGSINEAGKPGSNISTSEKLTGIRTAPSSLQDPEGVASFERYMAEKAWKDKLKHEDKQKYEKKAEEAEIRRKNNALNRSKLYGGPQ